VALKRDRIASFAEYPFSIPVIRHLDHLDLHPRMTILIGENGTGKSTLLEAIAVAAGLNPEGGSRNAKFRTQDTHSPILMAYPQAFLYLLTDAGITKVDYRDTEHYQITRNFLNHVDASLEELLRDESA
jgi:predicted ATPase